MRDFPLGPVKKGQALEGKMFIFGRVGMYNLATAIPSFRLLFLIPISLYASFHLIKYSAYKFAPFEGRRPFDDIKSIRNISLFTPFFSTSSIFFDSFPFLQIFPFPFLNRSYSGGIAKEPERTFPSYFDVV